MPRDSCITLFFVFNFHLEHKIQHGFAMFHNLQYWFLTCIVFLVCQMWVPSNATEVELEECLDTYDAECGIKKYNRYDQCNY